MILRQVPKARNYLKKAWTLEWNSDEADDIEKCWLLLAYNNMLVSLVSFRLTFVIFLPLLSQLVNEEYFDELLKEWQNGPSDGMLQEVHRLQ